MGQLQHDSSLDPEATVKAELDRLHDQLGRAAHRFADIDDVHRHRVRKRLKRLRYVAELVAPLYRSKEVKLYLRRLEPAQDQLGRYVDLALAAKSCREDASEGRGEAWFNAGWLQAQAEARIKPCERVLGRAAASTPFWRR
jgi:CHAD domain-containing protein